MYVAGAVPERGTAPLPVLRSSRFGWGAEEVDADRNADWDSDDGDKAGETKKDVDDLPDSDDGW